MIYRLDTATRLLRRGAAGAGAWPCRRWLAGPGYGLRRSASLLGARARADGRRRSPGADACRPAGHRGRRSWSRWSATSGSTAGPPAGALPFVPICAGDLVTVGARAAGPRSTCSTPTRPCAWTRTRSCACSRRRRAGQRAGRADAWRHLLPERGPAHADHPHALRERRHRGDRGLPAGRAMPAAELIVLEGGSRSPRVRAARGHAFAPAATGDRRAGRRRGGEADARTSLPSASGPFGALRRGGRGRSCPGRCSIPTS